MNEFFTWSMLTGYAGAVLATSLVTQLLKGLPAIDRMPTRLFSYLTAALLLLLSTFFTSGLSLESAALALVNAVVVALAANGAFDALQAAHPVKGAGEV